MKEHAKKLYYIYVYEILSKENLFVGNVKTKM